MTKLNLSRGRSLGKCPKCGNGYIRAVSGMPFHAGYECDGLMDPDDLSKELEPCDFYAATISEVRIARATSGATEGQPK